MESHLTINSMEYAVYGSTFSAGYLACRLQEAGLQTQWHRGPLRGRYRSFRLSHTGSQLLLDLFKRQQMPAFFVSQAPQMQKWGLPQGQKIGWAIPTREQDRLCDTEQALSGIDLMARRLGVAIHETPSIQIPYIWNQSRVQEIVDLDPLELDHARETLFPHPKTRAQMEVQEFIFSRGHSSGAQGIELCRVEGAYAFLEAHMKEALTLSLISSSSYALKRASLALLDPRGSAPTAWKALAALNPGARSLTYSVSVGLCGFFCPGVLGLGRSLGRLSPISNIEWNEHLLQAERLYKELMSAPRGQSKHVLAEQWRLEEQTLLLRNLKRSQWSQNLVFSDRYQGAALEIARILPPRVRHSLKAPI